MLLKVPSTEHEITFRTLDGQQLAGTLVAPDGPPEHSVVLVHGGGVTRHESGFFTRMAHGLAEATAWHRSASTCAATARVKAGKKN